MHVLTLGWEFPPTKNGGLGVACYGLTRELIAAGVTVTFLLPKTQETRGDARFLFADEERWLRIKQGKTLAGSYGSSMAMVTAVVGYDDGGQPITRSRSVHEEVERFAARVAKIAAREPFDIIHAHDWTSYLAGIAAKHVTGKPLVLHVHATSYDQAGAGVVDPVMFAIEQQGFAAADTIVAVSEYTKQLLVQQHAVAPHKIEVVHNGCDPSPVQSVPPVLVASKAQNKKIVLYHGRISVQKGVDQLMRAARRVVDVDPNVLFVVSGHGDMHEHIIRQVGALGLSPHVLFAGALWDTERDQMYQAADLLVMPSVSEPFGLVPLEALQHGTPALISRQSGVGEVLQAALRVDFWDTEEMANKILSALRYPVLRQQLVRDGQRSFAQHSWQRAAQKIQPLYQQLVHYEVR